MQTSDAPVRNFKEVRHKDFAKRVAQACDSNPKVPPQNYGRLAWFVKELETRFDFHSSPETVRKWLAGLMMPRRENMTMLAQILEVDPVWLSMGVAPELDSRQQKVRDASADGAVNVVAGFMQMDGATVAFPAADDQRAKDQHIDLNVIIKGAMYAVHVVQGVEHSIDNWRFAVPTGAENAFVLGVVRADSTSVKLFEIDQEILEVEGKRRGGFTELNVGADFSSGEHTLKQINGFRQRL